MCWGGQIKAMAIGLLRLALGPVASDTQWDIEGSGVPAAVAAAARGGGARERRGLARGAKVALAIGRRQSGIWNAPRGGGGGDRGTSARLPGQSPASPKRGSPGRRFCGRGGRARGDLSEGLVRCGSVHAVPRVNCVGPPR